MKIKIPSKDETFNFSKWWEQNKAVYEKINVDKEIAETIWKASIDATEKYLRSCIV